MSLLPALKQICSLFDLFNDSLILDCCDQQQFNSANSGVNLLANITVADVHVTTAVPEPSLALLAIGAVGTCVRRRR